MKKHGFPDDCDCPSEDLCRMNEAREERQRASASVAGVGEELPPQRSRAIRFVASADGRSIDDDDFTYDATLKITGDFTDGARLAYAQWICDSLNAALSKPAGEAAGVPVYAWLNPTEPFAIDAKMRDAAPSFFKDCTEPLVRLSDALAARQAVAVDADVERQRMESLRDSLRLDWCERHAVGLECIGSPGWMVFGDDTGDGQTLRAAIDTAARFK